MTKSFTILEIAYEQQTEDRRNITTDTDRYDVSGISNIGGGIWGELENSMVSWFNILLANMGCGLPVVDDWEGKHTKNYPTSEA